MAFLNSQSYCQDGFISFLVHLYVVTQFYPWFKFYFLSFLGMVMYDNDFETKGNKVETTDKFEPQHIYR